MKAVMISGWLVYSAAVCMVQAADLASDPARNPATDSATDPGVEAILDAVELAGDRVRDIDCRVNYRVDDPILESVKKRTGSIRFRKADPSQNGDQNPRFLVTFVKSVTDGVVARKKLWYMFDGRYLYEANERSRSTIKRDIAPPGEEFDFFSLEKAPFPIPFGQKKSEILKHFNVTVIAPAKDDPPHTDHLLCIPKPSSKFVKEYSRLEFFVSRSLDLPVRIVMTTPKDDKVISADFELTEDNINKGISEAAFRLPSETKGYAVAEE